MWIVFLLPIIIVILVWIFRRNGLTSSQSNDDSYYPINTDTSNSSCDVGDKDNLPDSDCTASDDSGSDNSSECGGDS